MDRLRVASLQYWIRPVDSFQQFENQVEGLIATASDYHCKLVVFPEYFTVQLLTLEDPGGEVPQQVRKLSKRVEQFVAMMSRFAKQYGIYIVAGTIPVMDPGDADRVYNESFFFAPTGEYHKQGKLHMTRWEAEDWHVSPRGKLRIFETDIGVLAIAICYDVEFPEIARAAAWHGADILVVPSCTDDRQGFLRVRYCAQARCIENQIYVVHSSTVGSLPMVPAVSLNYGQASILTPSDFPFSRDGILAEGLPNQETMVIGELNMEIIHHSRASGTVLPLHDSKHTAKLVAEPEILTF
ncbi:carbon-nitrogen hydrolase family protein [Planctomycetales bacterium ZRK34]|nr:carbon-nitrogen hydrolase family protein [Planctomycetales bacterium ZRK34]